MSYFRSSHAALGQGVSLVEPFLTICFFFLLLLPLLSSPPLPSSPSLETITALLLIQVLLKVISFLDRPRRMVLSLQRLTGIFAHVDIKSCDEG